MDCSILLMLGLLLNLSHCTDILEDDGDGGSEVEVQSDPVAVLGEEVYLRCLYHGNASITGSAWKRHRGGRVHRLAGFTNGTAFRRSTATLSFPASPTNLTVRMRVSGVDVEGEYVCVFESQDREFNKTVNLQVHVRPQTQLSVTAEMDNGTHYQSVRCSAKDGKPRAQIDWLINNKPPVKDYFSIERSDSPGRIGVSSAASILRFPTHLQDEGSVTCVVRHPTLASPVSTTVSVETFVAPRVSVQAEMRQRQEEEEEEEEDYWRVSCVASGGRPETLVSLVTTASDDDEEVEPRRENGTDAGTSVYRLPVRAYEGHNVSCVFTQPKLAEPQTRTLQLPSFSLSGVRLLSDPINELQASLELEEGQRDVSIGLEAVGNVPRYALFCQKEEASRLPGGVAVVGSALTFQAPVGLLHEGLYVCEASYYRHRATVQINITVRPRPVLLPPLISLDLRSGPSGREVQCSAVGANPAATLSWSLPEGVAAVPSPSASSPLPDGSRSVTGVLALGTACFPRPLAVGCVIHHPLFPTPEYRSVTIPLCAPPNISLSSREEWRGGEEYTVARCRVVSVATAATVTWRLGGGADGGDGVEIDDLEGVEVRTEEGQRVGLEVAALSTLRLPTSLYSGRRLSCEAGGHQERQHLLLPSLGAPVLNVSMGPGESDLWQAVCDSQAEGVEANLSWVLPAGSRGQQSRRSWTHGRTVRTRLTYRFALSSHEGDALTCLAEYRRRGSDKRTVHIPKYYISSLRVLNHTTRMKASHSGGRCVLRLSLHKSLPGQRILFEVEGNVPTHSITCQSSDGSFVKLEGDALAFPTGVKGRDEGLYTCLASFYHHQAELRLRVEVSSQDRQLANLVLICVPSASAAAVLLAVALWVFCKLNPGARRKKQETSALTALVRHLSSPEKSKALVRRPDGQQYAHLDGYCIVSDVKSTV
ncbi:unnamed protein product [Gadus morhua 'NCC']